MNTFVLLWQEYDLKIMLTVHQFFPEWQSGTEVLTLDTAKTLIARGQDVEIWTGHHQPHPKGLSYEFSEYQGIPVHRYYYDPDNESSGDRARTEYENQDFAKLFAGHIKERKPDIVHAFHLYRLSSSALKTAHNAGASTVFTPTDFWPICPAIQLLKPDDQLCSGPECNSWNCMEHLIGKKMPSYMKHLPPSAVQIWARLLELFDPKQYGRFRSILMRMPHHRRQLAYVDAILVPTHFMKKMLIDNGIPSKKFLHQSFGINLDHIHATGKNNRTDRLRIGFIGTLIRHKGPHVLIQAVKELPLDVPIDVRIYGRPTDVPEYSKYLHVLADNDSRISFCDTFPNNEIGKIMSDIDALVVPSIWYENTPLVVFSAQAAKTPVIASNLGGLSEVISHEVNGLLFTAGDPFSLAQTLLRVTNNPELLPRLGQNSRPPKSMDQYVDELEEIYGRILRKNIAKMTFD
jgi:glycosyltransferase involved in cell wall biosynthesis